MQHAADISSGRRGGLRPGKAGPRGRTREQLYQEAHRGSAHARTRRHRACLSYSPVRDNERDG